MSETTSNLLKAWNDAIDAAQRANSQIQAAASLFLAGKIDRAELAHFSAKADAATTARDAAETAYRNSYRR
jgi:hypothetical protein